MKNLSIRQLPIAIVSLLFLAGISALGQSFNYAAIDYPNAIRTRAWGISPGGVAANAWIRPRADSASN